MSPIEQPMEEFYCVSQHFVPNKHIVERIAFLELLKGKHE